MPFTCHAHAIPLPCRAAKGLDCVLPIWFTQCGCVWFTRHAAPVTFHDHAVPKATSQGHGTAQHRHGMAWQVWISIGRPETASGRPAHVRLLPTTMRSSTKVVISMHTNPLNCRTSSSYISGYHVDFHEEMALSENGRGMAWHVWINAARHGHSMACVN
jgi:hypothetical protein